MRPPLFLRAKHWQIFVPLMALPFVTMIIFIIVTAVNFAAEQPEGPEDVFGIFYFMPVLFALCAGTQFLWMWNVGVNLRKYIQVEGKKTRINLFRVTYFFPLIYMMLMPMLMVNFMSHVFSSNRPDFGTVIPFFLMVFVGNFFTFFCMLNNNYVVAKTIKMAELQRKVTFGDFVGDFFFLLIFPVAIWFLQPRINNIVNGEVQKSKPRYVLPEKDLLDD